MQKKALILASGEGMRMQSNIPKQFLLLNGLPILMHTIKAFSHFDEVYIVIKKNQKNYWEKLCHKYKFDEKHTVIYGGKTRFQSVKKGLKYIDAKSIVAIHDGVRPLISKKQINQLMLNVRKGVGVIPILHVKDSIKRIKASKSVYINRDDLYKVQTPQCFLSSDIKNAYEAREKLIFTDDASVFEYCGGAITTIIGEEKNIKITTNDDVLIASKLA